MCGLGARLVAPSVVVFARRLVAQRVRSQTRWPTYAFAELCACALKGTPNQRRAKTRGGYCAHTAPRLCWCTGRLLRNVPWVGPLVGGSRAQLAPPLTSVSVFPRVSRTGATPPLLRLGGFVVGSPTSYCFGCTSRFICLSSLYGVHPHGRKRTKNHMRFGDHSTSTSTPHSPQPMVAIAHWT